MVVEVMAAEVMAAAATRLLVSLSDSWPRASCLRHPRPTARRSRRTTTAARPPERPIINRAVWLVLSWEALPICLAVSLVVVTRTLAITQATARTRVEATPARLPLTIPRGPLVSIPPHLLRAGRNHTTQLLQISINSMANNITRNSNNNTRSLSPLRVRTKLMD